MLPWPGRSCARLLSTLLICQLALGPLFGPGPTAVRPEPVEGRTDSASLRVENAERAGLTRDLHRSLTGLEEPRSSGQSAHGPTGPGTKSSRVPIIALLGHALALEVMNAVYPRANPLGEIYQTGSDLGVLQRVFKAVRLKAGQKFMDLGSSDGRVVLYAALLGAEAMGLEIDQKYFGRSVDMTDQLSKRLSTYGCPAFERTTVPRGFQWTRKDGGPGSITLVRVDYLKDPHVRFEGQDVVFRAFKLQGSAPDTELVSKLSGELKEGALFVEHQVETGAEILPVPFRLVSTTIPMTRIYRVNAPSTTSPVVLPTGLEEPVGTGVLEAPPSAEWFALAEAIRQPVQRAQQWFESGQALSRPDQVNRVLGEAYWAQLQFLKALGFLHRVVYPAMGADLLAADAADEILSVDPNAAVARHRAAYNDLIKRIGPLSGFPALEHVVARLRAAPWRLDDRRAQAALRAYVQTARAAGPVTVVLKGFSRYAGGPSFEQFLEPVLRDGDLAVLFGEPQLAEHLLQHGWRFHETSRSLPPGIGEIVEQTNQQLATMRTTYRYRPAVAAAGLSMHLAAPFLVLEKRALTGLEEPRPVGERRMLTPAQRGRVRHQVQAGFERIQRRVELELDQLVQRPSWIVEEEIPFTKWLDSLMVAMLDHPRPRAARPQVRAILDDINRTILPRLRTLDIPRAFSLPVADDWLAAQTMGFYDDVPKGTRRVQAEVIYSPRSAALSLGVLGFHFRRQLTDEDRRADIPLYPLLLEPVLPHLGTLIAQAETARHAGRPDHALENRTQRYAVALFGGLLFPNARRYLPRWLQTLRSHRVSQPTTTLRRAGHWLHQRCAESPRRARTVQPALVFTHHSFGPDECESIEAYNQRRPPRRRISLWDVVTGAPRASRYRWPYSSDFQYRRAALVRSHAPIKPLYRALLGLPARRAAGLEEPRSEDARARAMFPAAWWSGRAITAADIEAERAVFTMLKPEAFRLISETDARRIAAAANNVITGTEALNGGRGVTVGAVLGAQCTAAALAQMTYAQVAMALFTGAQGMGYEVAFRGAATPMRAPTRFYGPALGDRPGVLAMVVSYFTPSDGPPRVVVPMVLWRPAGDARTLLRDHALGGWKGDQPATLRYLLGVELAQGGAPNEQLAKNHVHVTDSVESMRREMRETISGEWLQRLWPMGVVPVLVQADQDHVALIRDALGSGYRVQSDPAMFDHDGAPRVLIVDSPAPEFVSAARARWPAVKILALLDGGVPFSGDALRTVDAQVFKPMDLAQLVGAVREMVDAAGPSAGLEEHGPSAAARVIVEELAVRRRQREALGTGT